jgi:hypothetical protein
VLWIDHKNHHDESDRRSPVNVYPEMNTAIVRRNVMHGVHGIDRTHTKAPNDSPILALMLLHEIGHISRGEWGRYEHHNRFEVADLLGIEDPHRFDKNSELTADRFAANQVRKATQDTAARFSAAIIVGSALSVHQFSVFGDRVLDGFLSLSMDRFLDSGYTHPNYELRMLVILNLVNRDEGSLRLLNDFLSQRKAAKAKRN